jgi:hypothetical protein
MSPENNQLNFYTIEYMHETKHKKQTESYGEKNHLEK